MLTRYIKDSHLYGVGESVVGQVRPHNEDNCGYAQTPLGHLFIVCDGMGGHAAGEVASKIAVDSVIESIRQCSSDINPCDALTSAIQFANMQILGMASADATKKGMGTTICAAIVKDDSFWIAHVGDSRIYLYSKEKKFLYRVSEDHSFVQALVKQGKLDDRDAESHPQKNVILRALGTKETVEVDVEQHPLRLACGDILLMCSDGLSGMIDDSAMQSIIESKENLEDCVDALVSAANTPDKGKDNITCQLIRMENPMAVKSSFPDYTPAWRRKTNITSGNTNLAFSSNTNHILMWGFLGGISAAIAAIFIFFAVRHLINRKPIEGGGEQDEEVVTKINNDTTPSNTKIAFDRAEIIIKDRPGLYPLKGYLLNSEGKDLSWESKNKYIPIDSLGQLNLSGVSDEGGTATIVVSTSDGESCDVKVKVEKRRNSTTVTSNPTSISRQISFDREEIHIENRPGLYPLISYLRNSEGKELSWRSDNPRIPVDSMGQLNLSNGGTATIVVSTSDGKSCKVKVNIMTRPTPQRIDDSSELSLDE